MYMREVIIPVMPTTGGRIDVLDPQAVKENFDTIRNEDHVSANCIKELNARLTRLETFMTFCRDNWPQVLRDFAVVEAAKARVGVPEAPLPSTNMSLLEEVDVIVKMSKSDS